MLFKQTQLNFSQKKKKKKKKSQNRLVLPHASYGPNNTSHKNIIVCDVEVQW